jgi:5'-3' exonuclease
MKKLILTLAAVAAISISWAQKVPGTANVIEGKVVYIESNPATQYRHLGTVTCGLMFPDKFDLMMEHMIKRVAKEFPDVEYDALIFRPGTGFCKADIIQFYRDPKAKKRKPKRGEEISIDPSFQLSESVGRGGVNIFIENNPTAEYILLGKVEVPQNFRNSDYEEIIKEMTRVAKEAYPDLDGVVITSGTGLRKANVIKLK